MNLYCTESEQVETLVREEIERNDLLRDIHRLGIAVSGGADSLALLLLLHPICAERQIAPVVLMVDHGREGEADACAFVASVAERLGLPFFTRKGDVNAQLHPGESIELAARKLRMAFLQELVEENRLDAVATGHHADDVAETVFLRLCRGSGVSGLAGLRARSQNGYVTVVRPLLRISHAALCEWLRKRGERWIEDPDNQDESSRRVLLRRRIFPFLTESFDDSLLQHLCRTAEFLREEDEWMVREARRQLARFVPPPSRSVPPSSLVTRHSSLLISIPLCALRDMALPLRRRLLREWLFDCQLGDCTGWEMIDRILEQCETGEKNWVISLTQNARILCRDGTVRLELEGKGKNEAPSVAELPEAGELVWGAWTLTVRSLSAQEARREADQIQRNGGFAAAIAQCACNGESLRVRSRRPGDRIAPTGLEGSRKVQDVMTDAKIPRELRDQLPLVVCGETVVWFPGSRISRSFALTDEVQSAWLLQAEGHSLPRRTLPPAGQAC